MYVYDTMTAAVNGLKARGYDTDFNLADNCLVCQGAKYGVEDFEIVEVYRFEGDSDPADESIIYAIEGNQGHKGMLVSGYGTSAEGVSAEMAKKLAINTN